MILTQNEKSVRQVRSESWLVAALLGMLVLGLGYIFWNYHYRPVSLNEGEAIICDAERVRGRHFVNGNYEFDQGDWQSREKARSGWFSCRVPEGEGAQYGFGYKLESFAPGEAYRARVWRYRNNLNEGKLAVNGSGEDGFYHESAEVMQREEGWEMLEITFHIPYQSRLEGVKIYVYTDGHQSVFFDDLQIERLEVWSEEVFQRNILELEVGNGALQKLEQKREEAIRAGILFTESDDWVNARIRETDQDPIPVRVRLKGDWLDHLSGDKWSFRIKVKDPYQWRHLTEFSLHTPAARYHLHEWVLHQLWETADVLTTRYDLVELQLNGTSKGIYAYEEHFVKQLVESRQRREGPIIKLSEEGLWQSNQRQLDEHGFIVHSAEYSAASDGNADIVAFDEEDMAGDTTFGPQLQRAKGLLAGFRKGTLPAARVFDLQRMAAYYAACDVMNGYHGTVWHNQRFYYNPITDRLEPIGFDGFGGPPEESYTFLGEGALNPRSLMSTSLFAALSRDTAFIRPYIQTLEQFSSDRFFYPFLDSLQAGWTARKAWLRMEFPGYRTDLEDLRTRARFVHSLILPFAGQSLKAHRLNGTNDQVVVHNTHTLPLEIIGWSTSDRNKMTALEACPVLPGQMPRSYLSRLRADSVIRDFAGFRFLEEAAISNQGIPQYDTIPVPASARLLYYRPLGLDSIFTVQLDQVITAAIPDPNSLWQGKQLKMQAFFSIDRNRIIFHPGKHQIKEHLYIPAGYQVEFPAGTELDLQAGAGFFSRSPVHLLGEPDSLVRIYSSDGKGGGFTVMGAVTTSVIKNTDFSGLNTLQAGSWQLTGAVNFYESSVRIYRCRFYGNRCEDALNIIRSEFQLDACRFERTFSDAFDSDFSKGEIRNCGFLNTGNDGLDVSGSVVNVFECIFDTNGDKGISVGEESDVHVFNSSFRNAPIAMASKDLSMLYARNITLADCEQGFAAYQKKPEFGGATLIVESYRAENVGRLYVEGEGSRVQIGLDE
jgi:hypothetical protein